MYVGSQAVLFTQISRGNSGSRVRQCLQCNLRHFKRENTRAAHNSNLKMGGRGVIFIIKNLVNIDSIVFIVRTNFLIFIFFLGGGGSPLFDKRGGFCFAPLFDKNYDIIFLNCFNLPRND